VCQLVLAYIVCGTSKKNHGYCSQLEGLLPVIPQSSKNWNVFLPQSGRKVTISLSFKIDYQRWRERIVKANKCIREWKDRWKQFQMKFNNIFLITRFGRRRFQQDYLIGYWSRCQVQDDERKLRGPLRGTRIRNNVKRMDLKRQRKRSENLLKFGCRMITLSRDRMIRDGVCIGDSIYCTL
jgi:hypothetical protein